jgi:DNA polymerase III epsilon subunit-like protein
MENNKNKMKFKHISFDLETLGNTPTAPIVQIGACKFNTDGLIADDKFIRTVKLDSLEAYNFHIDMRTVRWWFSQDDKAIKSVFCTDEEVALRLALRDFIEWAGSLGDYYYWSHATFDPPILNNNMLQAGLGRPIPFRLFRDIRTLMHFAGKTDGGEREGIHHNALDDAVFQAGYISKAIQKLTK